MTIRRPLFAATCLLCSMAACGQGAQRPATNGWSAGALVLVSHGGYVGDANRTLVVPAVGYEGKYVYFRGLQLGWHAWRQDGLQLDLVAQARMGGFDARDIPITGLQDRRDSLDVGAMLSWSGNAGKLKFTALTDALDRSGGQQLALDYGYPISAGRVRITPEIGVRWWSSKLADYYYGIRPAEVARGAPAVYDVGSTLVPEVGVNVVAPLSQRWSLWGALRYQQLPSAIADSPLVSTSHASTLLLGVSYAF